MGEHTGVYATFGGKTVDYCVIDQSKVAVWHHSVRIGAGKLDRHFSERLVYRVGEALKTSAHDRLSDGTSERLEAAYQQITQQLDRTFQEAEQSQGGEIIDPQALLENSIRETQASIAEKERVGNVASSEMSDEDLKLHFASLKRLRAGLAAMQYKLDRLGAEARNKRRRKKNCRKYTSAGRPCPWIPNSGLSGGYLAHHFGRAGDWLAAAHYRVVALARRRCD